MSDTIHFFKEEVKFRLSGQKYLRRWISRAATFYGFRIETINYIFCDDRYLLKLNKKFLGHNTYTDIITFDESEEAKKLTADIFISIDRVKVNADKFNVSIKDELHRVMIHGALHLFGYSDKTKNNAEEMRKLENEWLSKRSF